LRVEQAAPLARPRNGSLKSGYALLLASPTMKRPHRPTAVNAQ